MQKQHEPGDDWLTEEQFFAWLEKAIARWKEIRAEKPERWKKAKLSQWTVIALPAIKMLLLTGLRDRV